MNKRYFIKYVGGVLLGFLPVLKGQAKTYLTVLQAQQIMFPDLPLEKTPIKLSKEQQKAIKKASKVRVRSKVINAWKTSNNDWFIVDQVIGKHENIDMAVAIDHQGQIKDVEVLTYRESYGHEVRHPKWLGQFFGKTSKDNLKLTKQVRNISGATLSCKHVTEGINRLLWTWQLALKDQ